MKRQIYQFMGALIYTMVTLGCTMSVSITEYPSVEGGLDSLLEFNSTHLDLTGLSSSIYSTENGLDGYLDVKIDLQEHLYKNKIKIANLPAGAVIKCDGTQSNLALQSVDLSSENEFRLSTYYWLESGLEWLEKKDQSFSCWYELENKKSNVINFFVTINESDIVIVSSPKYTGIEKIGGTSNSVISGDGNFLVFASSDESLEEDKNYSNDIFVLNMLTGKTMRVSVDSNSNEANKDSYLPVINKNGRIVAFQSYATNLVIGDTNNKPDIFVHDLQTGQTKRVSVDSSGFAGNDSSSSPAISGDGRFVTFQSYATNLVVGDTNNQPDIFVHDLQTGQTKRVSVDSSGAQGNGFSNYPSISEDGRHVVYFSSSSNLVSGDTNNKGDIFFYNLETNQTKRISIDSSGAQGNLLSTQPSISYDGRFIAFESSASNLVAGDTGNLTDIFIHDVQDEQTKRVSLDSNGVQGNSSSFFPKISGDGKFVVFESYASNLSLNDTNNKPDIFIHNLQTGQTICISISNFGDQGNDKSFFASVTADGRYVSFTSNAANFDIDDTNETGDTFIYDNQLLKINRISFDSPGVLAYGDSFSPSSNADGRYTSFSSYAYNLISGDTNGKCDIFVQDRKTGQVRRASVDSSGIEGNNNGSFYSSLSEDGRFVAFQSFATNLVLDDNNNKTDIFVHDFQAGLTRRVSIATSGDEGDNISDKPVISADGQFVVFQSNATNLVAGDTNSVTDIFIHDLQTGQTKLVSVNSSGDQGNQGSFNPSLSKNGRYVVYESYSTNLEPGDSNTSSDIFVFDTQINTTMRVSLRNNGLEGDLGSFDPVISSDGRYVVFESDSTNLISGDSNNSTDVFIRDLQLGTTTRISKNSLSIEGDSDSYDPSVSDDGRYISFVSYATNLVSGDINEVVDVFIHDQLTGQTKRLSEDQNGIDHQSSSEEPSMSGNGKYISFYSYAPSLVKGDSNMRSDIFIRKNPFYK